MIAEHSDTGKSRYERRLSQSALAKKAGVSRVLLYALFLADCFVLLAGAGRDASYDPTGGASLIVILLVIGGVHRLRCGPGDDY